MSDSKRRPAARKPAARIRSERKAAMGLPPEFPLFPHKSGRWAKKVRGTRHYFGKVSDDPKGQAALRLWLDQKDDLLAGRKPRPNDENGRTLANLCNAFLASKRTAVEKKTLSPRSFVEYKRTTDLLIDTFGRNRSAADLRPTDFVELLAKLVKKHGLVTLGREITMVRSVFKFGVDADLLNRAVKFGPEFRVPSRMDKRKERAKSQHQHGKRVFSAEDISLLLESAGPQLRAMILLGINAGLGNTDVASLPVTAIDLKNAMLDFPRVKTGVQRRAPLWPETVEALEAVLAKRQKPRDERYAHLVFLTRLGQPWVRYELAETKDEEGKLKITGKADDAVAKATTKLLKQLGIYRAKVTSFYTLRHTCETIGGGCAEQVALDLIMGHLDQSMAENYRHEIDDDRLRRVAEHVRAWLYPSKKSKERLAGNTKQRPVSEQKVEVPRLRVFGWNL